MSLLVVNGSANPVALSQVKHGLESGMEGLKVRPEEMRIGNVPTRRRENSILFSIEDIKELGSYTLSAEVFNQKFAEMAVIVWKEGSASVLCVFGGDTLMAILKILGVNIIRPLREILPGLVLAGFEHQGKERYLISKAGSFGEKKLLDKILKLIK